MPTFRVYLECSSPTGRRSDLYDTFVAVSDEEQAAGEHLRVACRRAGILGYGGPYVVREVRRLGPVIIVAKDVFAVRPTGRPDDAAARQSERLARLVAGAEREEPRRESELRDHPTATRDGGAAPRRAPARRGRAGVR